MRRLLVVALVLAAAVAAVVAVFVTPTNLRRRRVSTVAEPAGARAR